jgi:hypothetical protein
MADDSVRREIRAAFAAEARDGESPVLSLPAMTIHDGHGGLAIEGVWPLLMAVSHLVRRHRDRVASRAAQFPLSSRMVLVLTDQRLLIWAARRRWRPGRFLGDVPRDRILEVTSPPAGTRWRTAEFRLADGTGVSVRTSARSLGQLLTALSGSSAGQPEATGNPG